MRSTEQITLISYSVDFDELKDEVLTPTESTIYANEFSVDSSDFNDAGVDGMKAEKQFEIYSFEYDGQKQAKHDGKTYEVMRTQKRGEKLRILLGVAMGNE